MRKRDYFKEVCHLVDGGMTVAEACEEIGVGRGSFYNQITKEQKHVLDQLRISSRLSVKKVGVKLPGSEEYEAYQDLHEFFTEEDDL